MEERDAMAAAARLIETGSIQEAIDLMVDHTLDEPTNGRRIMDLGGMLILARRPAEALRVLEKAHEYLPGDPSLVGYRGQAHYYKGDHNAARADFDRSLETDPHNIAALNGLGMLQIDDEQYAAAEETFTRLMSAHGAYPPILSERAYARVQMGRIREAIADCTQALEMDPNFVPALRTRCSLYEMCGDAASARADQARLDGLYNAAHILDLVQRKGPETP